MRFSLPFQRRKYNILSSFTVSIYYPCIPIRKSKPNAKNRLGIGAPLPQKAADGSWNRSELDSNDKLRKQLLGKNYDRVMKAAAEQKAAAKPVPAAVNTSENKADEDDYDEEDGRSAMLARQKNKRKGGAGSVHPAAAAAASLDADQEDKSAKRPAPSKGRKKATSYLDELLAERAKKRKKR